MTVTINLWTLIFLFTAFHGIWIVGLLFSTQRKRDYIPNRWMAALMFTFTSLLFISIGYWNYWHETFTYIHINQTYWPFVFLMPPLMYLYLESQIKPNKTNQEIHFLIPILVLLILLPFYLKSAEGKLTFFEEKPPSFFYYTLWSVVLPIMSILQYTLYTYFNFNLIRQFEKETAANEKMETPIKWLGKLVVSFLVYTLCYAFYNILSAWVGLAVEWDYLLSLLMSIMIYYVGMKAYTQPSLFKEREKLVHIAKKMAQPLINDEEGRMYKELIMNIMQKEKPYLDDQLKLADLARMMELSTHQLSYFLNCYMNTNYSDFINQFRVEAAKVMLLDPKMSHLKILAIGYEAGFNSKTAFYTTFKKNVGMTPSAYQAKFC